MDRLWRLSRLAIVCAGLLLLAACASPIQADGLSRSESDTLDSLEKLDDYPLYTMKLVGAYSDQALAPAQGGPAPAWGCSLFATLSEGGERLYGRNFDWEFSPALLLFTAPPDGYASVSMVDMDYLGFGQDRAGELLDLPLSERRALLNAYKLPFDGMNDQGLAVGMAAVPPGEMTPDPKKSTIGQLRVMREILDHAATVEEAVEILGRDNIDMSEVPIHYLVAGVAGKAALVEFYQGEMVVTYSSGPWQAATNFLQAATDGKPAGQCPRYDRIQERMDQTQGVLTSAGAFDLLGAVSQANTQWSVLYNMETGKVQVVMGGQYGQKTVTSSLTMDH